MTDIVERLRRDSKWTEGLTDQQIEEMCNEAADEIEMLRGVEQDAAEWVEEQTKRLRADNERLRAALRDIAEDDIYLRNCATWHDTGKMKTGVQAFARAALENKNGCIKISFSTRDDGGLRIWSDDLPGLVLSGSDPSAVWRDLGIAIEVILNHKKS